MGKFRKRWLAFLMALAMVVTSAGTSGMTLKVASAATYASEAEATLAAEDYITTEWHGASISAAGIDISKLKGTGTKVTAYVKVTKAHPYSFIRFSVGSYDMGEDCPRHGENHGTSNKALAGQSHTAADGGNTNGQYIIHHGYRTEAPGSGMGSAGSGIYAFPEASFNSSKFTSTDPDEEMLLRLQIRTKDTEARLVGVKFADGQSLTVNEDGSLQNGFDVTKIKLESVTADESDMTDEQFENKEEEEKRKEEEQKQKEEAARTQARTNLKTSIDACKALDASLYQAESFAKLAPAITTAETAYAKEDDTRLNYKAARDTLDSVRVGLLFKDATDPGKPKAFRSLGTTGAEEKKAIIDEMAAGINLGNTLDGNSGYTPGETAWQAYKTTKAYIKALHDAGYNTVRVPVTWGTMINDDYSINEAWMSRVQEIVDYCTDQDMYCIINIHHDGIANHDERGDNPTSWLNTNADNTAALYDKFGGVWKTIANRFKNYDEHLIFESMNEVTDDHNGTTGNEDAQILNNLNQLFVNVVRATGSNNTKRWLAFTGRFATCNDGMVKPDDPYNATNRLMFAVHIYKDNTKVRWTYDQLKTWKDSMSGTSSRVAKMSSDIPIYVGEYGVRQQVQAKTDTGMNNIERALNSEFCAATADYFGACPIVWDQGDGNYVTTETNTGLFNYWNRPALKPVYQDTIEGMIRGSYLKYSSNLDTRMEGIYTSYGHSTVKDNSVSKNPTVNKITEVTVDSKVNMKAGEHKTLTAEVTPADTNDVLLWSTDDDAVATVSKGHIHAKGTGITTVHVYSQSKSVTKDIQVVVSPSGQETATSITTDKAYYEIVEGKTATIKTTVLPANSQDEIKYTSSNPEVATVSSTGQITAESVGSTYIIVSAASGISNIVKVKVKKEGTGNQVGVTLNLLFNGDTTEKSQPITLTGDGQYSLSYDLATELSAEGREAGITKLENLTSIYIRDTNTLRPVVESANIRFDKVVVNDQELTLKTPDELNAMWESSDLATRVDAEGFKNIVKDSGQLDSNDPINGWDGSVVKEVATADHLVNFTSVDNPTKIRVDFTIKDMKFTSVKEKKNEAKTMKIQGSNKIKMAAAGDTAEAEVILTPANTDSFVTAYSTNSSVVAVDSTATEPNVNGVVKIPLTAISEGTATVVALTENNLKVFWSVGVGNVTLQDPVDPTPPGLDGTSVAQPKAQTITVAKSIQKAYGSKAFALGAKTNGNGKLTYSSSDRKVVTVSESGKVTVKGYGTSKITIKAAATSTFKAATATTTITIVPKKAALKSAKNVKGKKVKVTWKKDKTVSGYEISYSTNKKFKKGTKKALAKKAKLTKKTIKKLKKKKTYYVRIRAYKTVGKKKLYGAYSKTKKVKIKK